MDAIELLFIDINKMKSRFHFSLDVYYNDIDNTFVAKISNVYATMNHPDSHYRKERLIDALLSARDYLKTIS